MRISGKPRITLILWWLFIGVILLVYFVYTQPLNRFVMRLQPMVVALVFVLSCTGWGAMLGRKWLSRVEAPLKQVTFAALGAGLTAMFVLVVGLSGYLGPVPFLCWTAAGVVLFAISLPLWWGLLTKVSFATRSWDCIAIFTILFFLVFNLPYFISPEVSSDALAYHLTLPRLYLNIGKIGAVPLLTESNYPFLAEYNYLMVLSLSNEITCKCLHFLCGLLVLVAIAALVKKISPPSGSLLAPALFLSMPVAVVQLGWAWNDFFFTLYMMLCLYYLVSYETDRDTVNLLLAGLMAGLASCTKYTFVIFLPALCLIAWTGVRNRQWKLSSLWRFFLPVAALSFVWMAKNWVFTGNPVYPLLNGIFNSPSWSDSQQQYYSQMITRFYIQDWRWYSYIFFPVSLILKPEWMDIHTGVLPLLFLPLLFRKSESSAISMLKIYLGASFVLWLFFQTGIRTLFPFLAILLCLSSIELCKSAQNKYLWRFVVVICLVLNFIVTRVNVDYVFNPFPFSVGLESEGDYLKRVSSSERAYDYLNSQPKVGHVLLLSMHGPLYLKRPAYFSGRFDRPVAEIVSQDCQTLEDLTKRFRELWITHMAVDLKTYELENAKRLYTWSPKQRRIFEEFLRERLRTAVRFENIIVLEWQASQ